MKKVLLSLLLFHMFTMVCTAQDYTDEGNYTVSMIYTKAPSYTVKLPKTVNVINENTIMDFYVKGDIYADQTLSIVFADTYISCNDRSIPVTVSQSKNSWTCSELNEDYMRSSVSISHTKLSAGTWFGYMNVAISLQGGS
ncbi:MAG: hypothetical protein IJH00_05415 [Erysipelotrichaceae bacterium]|nr:hypothetical protein [Erysipelotrichaceae bacterium]